MWWKVRIELLHYLVFILLQSCLHYWCHSWNKKNGSFWWFAVWCDQPFNWWRALALLFSRYIDHSMYLQGMHITLPGPNQFVFPFDEVIFGVRTSYIVIICPVIIIVEYFCHCILSSIWACANLESPICRVVKYRRILAAWRIFIWAGRCSVVDLGAGLILWQSRHMITLLSRYRLVHDYFIYQLIIQVSSST